MTITWWDGASQNQSLTNCTSNGNVIAAPTIGDSQTTIVSASGDHLHLDRFDANATFYYTEDCYDTHVATEWTAPANAGTLQMFIENSYDETQCSTCSRITGITALTGSTYTFTAGAPLVVTAGIDNTPINPTTLAQGNFLPLGVGLVDPGNGNSGNVYGDFFNANSSGVPILAQLDGNANPPRLNFIDTQSGGLLGYIDFNSARGAPNGHDRIEMDNGLAFHFTADNVQVVEIGCLSGGGNCTGVTIIPVLTDTLGTCNAAAAGSWETIKDENSADGCVYGATPVATATAGVSCPVFCGSGNTGSLAWTIH